MFISTAVLSRAPLVALLVQVADEPPPEAPPDPLSLEGLLGLFQRPVVVATAIVMASFVVAKIADWFVTRVARVLAKRTKMEFDDALIDSLHGPIVKTVVLGGLWLACKQLELADGPAIWVHRMLVTLAVLVWITAALRASGLLLRAMSHNDSRFQIVEERTLPLFDNLGKVLLVGLAGYLLIEVWALDATGWLASAGVVGIALGFAAKDTLANLFSGVFIIADGPYHVGDYVVLDSGHRGQVLHIGLRSTRILTRDDVQITVPNSIIGNGAIVNETSGTPRYRLRVKVGVAYGSDIDQVRVVLMQVAQSEESLLVDPEPRVRFRRFGDSTLDFELLGWIAQPELRGRVLDALNTAVYKRFAEAGIEIAFPQRDLHVRSLPEGWSSRGV